MGPFRGMRDETTPTANGAEMRRLWAEGRDGTAVITALADTGERLAGNTVLALQLMVSLPGRDPYPVTHRLTIAGSDATAYAPGTQHDVKVDANAPTNLVFSA